MYCNKCGTANPDDAAYCKKCGNLLEAEDETRVAKRRADAPERAFSIAPTLKFVYAGYALTVVMAFLLVAVLAMLAPMLSPLFGVAVGVALLLVPGYYHLRQKLVRYSLTDATIEIDRGVVSRSTQNIPLRRVQDVTVTATLLQRMLGYGDITIDNASEDGGKVVLDNVDSPRKYADMILRRMSDLER